MKRVTRRITVFVEVCLQCGKEIEGPTEKSAKYNLETHLRAKHSHELKE